MTSFLPLQDHVGKVFPGLQVAAREALQELQSTLDVQVGQGERQLDSPPSKHPLPYPRRLLLRFLLHLQPLQTKVRCLPLLLLGQQCEEDRACDISLGDISQTLLPHFFSGGSIVDDVVDQLEGNPEMLPYPEASQFLLGSGLLEEYGDASEGIGHEGCGLVVGFMDVGTDLVLQVHTECALAGCLDYLPCGQVVHRCRVDLIQLGALEVKYALARLPYYVVRTEQRRSLAVPEVLRLNSSSRGRVVYDVVVRQTRNMHHFDQSSPFLDLLLVGRAALRQALSNHLDHGWAYFLALA